MKLKFLTLFLLLIALTGCKDDNQNTARQTYDINDKSDEIRDEVKFSLRNSDIYSKNNLSNSGDAVSDQNDPIDIYHNDVVYEEDDNASLFNGNSEKNSNNNELASFSTKILTNDNNRYNNISIVADRLNNYVLKPRRNFFF